MEAVVAPVDQVIPVVTEDVSVTEPPSQKVVAALAVITGGAIDVTLIIFEAEEEHPAAVTTTE